MNYILSEFITLHEHDEEMHKADLDCARYVRSQLKLHPELLSPPTNG